MKWTYSIRNKFLASTSLVILCMLVLFSNCNDRRHTDNVKSSIKTLYEDRLVAEHYILKMTNYVYQVREILLVSDRISDSSATQIRGMIAGIHELGAKYLNTKFTRSEDVKFMELSALLNEFESHPGASRETKVKEADRAIALLNDLSIIQLDESQHIMAHSEKLFTEGKTLSQFAFVIIVVILVVLQALVFASRPIRAENERVNLN